MAREPKTPGLGRRGSSGTTAGTGSVGRSVGNRRRAAKAPRTKVKVVPFDTIDDGRIDLLNLDCEGSEWAVVKNMRSRPRFIQIELYPQHGHRAELEGWLRDNDYQCVKRWGNANQILVRREKV